jgi:hypothetical protein
VIGLRHSKLYAEVVKVLTSGPDIRDDHLMAGLVRSMNDALLTVVHPDKGAPTDYVAMQRIMGAKYWLHATSHLPRGAPLRFEHLEDVPEDLALSAAVSNAFNFLETSTPALLVFSMLPWVARAAPEQLYLPREAVRARWIPWEPEMALGHLLLHRDYYVYKKPQRRPEGPARKGPCPCGSGKKYKRCCGAEEESEPGDREEGG